MGRGASKLFRCECGSHKERTDCVGQKTLGMAQKSGDDSFVNVVLPNVCGSSKRI